jgi:hypothetical protein
MPTPYVPTAPGVVRPLAQDMPTRIPSPGRALEANEPPPLTDHSGLATAIERGPRVGLRARPLISQSSPYNLTKALRATVQSAWSLLDKVQVSSQLPVRSLE